MQGTSEASGGGNTSVGYQSLFNIGPAISDLTALGTNSLYNNTTVPVPVDIDACVPRINTVPLTSKVALLEIGRASCRERV